MKCFNFADMSVNNDQILFRRKKKSKLWPAFKSVQTNSTFRVCLFSSEVTNLVQPGGTAVQGEDVTQSGVCGLLHWSCWHVAYCYACRSRQQVWKSCQNILERAQFDKLGFWCRFGCEICRFYNYNCLGTAEENAKKIWIIWYFTNLNHLTECDWGC